MTYVRKYVRAFIVIKQIKFNFPILLKNKFRSLHLLGSMLQMCVYKVVHINIYVCM